ncbi:hypothetical protein BJX68DRAFT_181209 [Aspergillus pseudodeflectus]|uniref:Uncharacterized protein n=1 Tax=Aspergillus pseudodeflectus TaxID=176178 RepID=A0ABR4JM15_9EURO
MKFVRRPIFFLSGSYYLGVVHRVGGSSRTFQVPSSSPLPFLSEFRLNYVICCFKVSHYTQSFSSVPQAFRVYYYIVSIVG